MRSEYPTYFDDTRPSNSWGSNTMKIVYHRLQMRRGFSILLMLVFGLMPLSPLIDGSEDASLPACCRRHGTHHCSMNVAEQRAMMAPVSTPVLAVPPTCPNYPDDATAFCAPPPALTVSTPSVSILVEHVNVASAGAAAPESAPETACAGRGPPAENLG